MDKPDKWCIYRVPTKLRIVNEAAYTPQLLSIGLFHHGKPGLEDMETHKKMYFKNFCSRFSKNEDELKWFIRVCKEKILQCYAGTIEVPKKKDPVDIILVDACFIVELLLLNSIPKNCENDYILGSPWLRKAVQQELILFENQLPYSLLDDLYKFAQPFRLHSQSCKGSQAQEHGPYSCDSIEIVVDGAEAVRNNFLELSCMFFKDMFFKDHKKVKVTAGTNGVFKPKHFTDLVRHFMCPEEKNQKNMTGTQIKNAYDINMLAAAGVKFGPIPEDVGLFMKIDKKAPCKLYFPFLKNMDLKLTELCVKDDTECIIRNVMALEQFVYPDQAYVCNYFLLMDQLVDTVEDVELLICRKVIVNMLGSNEAVAKMLNGLCDHIMEESSCYVDVCGELNKHYECIWNRSIATLKRVYFKDLWTCSSTILGLVVLVFSIIGSIQSFK